MRRNGRNGLVAAVVLASAVLLMGAADGGWLKKVPDADRQRVNPYSADVAAASAGRQIFEDNCAKCHGRDAAGKYNRPSLRSERVTHATDGELAWILKNGSTWKGMPSWGAMPEQQRWQVVSYLRSLRGAAKPGDVR